MSTKRSGFSFQRGILGLIRPRVALVFLLIQCWDLKNGTATAKGPFDTHRQVINLRSLGGPPVGSIQLDTSASTVSEEAAVLGPFVGNVDEMVTERRKKNCGLPARTARALMHPNLKRSYFALSQAEVSEKEESENRQKREVKRNELLADGPLPWTCETKYEWKDMGSNHYPRFVRTAECKSRHCFNGFFRCKPRRYKTKVLRRLTGDETASCEDDDVSLPESLRDSWKFITVTINLCCDCTGRMPPPEGTA